MNIKKELKKRLIAYPIILFVACCASPVVKFKGNHEGIDSQIKPYVDYIYELSEGRLNGYDMSMGFLPENELNKRYFAEENRNILGVCTWKWGGLKNELDFNKDAWKYLSIHRKLLLVAHEIRHCYCYEYFHNETLLKDQCPYSFMYPSLMQESCIVNHRKHYFDEIKRGCN